MTDTVAAVVVTYNRKELLLECLDALLAQTRPVDKILLIDNNSTDGTPELLKEKGYLENSLIEHIRLPENTGGAGGFYEGIKRGYEAGYDWVWCMDDDGKPAIQCLETLTSHFHFLPNSVIAPIVVTPNNSSYLSFAYTLDNIPKERIWNVDILKNFASPSGIIKGSVPFFNAVLIPKKIISTVGYPRKEMFIWGDEVEYRKRIIHAKFNTYIICKAVHYHPQDKIQMKPILLDKVFVSSAPISWKTYCYFRNVGLLSKLYDKLYGLPIIVKYFYYYLIVKKLDFRSFLFFINSFIDGFIENFSKKVPY